VRHWNVNLLQSFCRRKKKKVTCLLSTLINIYFPGFHNFDQTYRLGISEIVGLSRLRSLAFYNSKRPISEACADGPTRKWRGRRVVQ
jgi:hypothetical protein